MLMSRVAILLICACLSLVSYADSKPNLVLLPLDVSESEMNLVSEFGSALHQGLQDRYTVFFGAAVERELDKEYSKLDCTAESCNQNVAIAFNGELVGDGSVKRVGNGYILKLVIQNVLTNEIIETQAIPCSTCDAFQVITQLKQLGSGKALASNIAASNTSLTTRVSGTGVIQGQVIRIDTGPATAVKNSKAILVFDSEPSGAEVWLNGKAVGTTPYQGMKHKVGDTFSLEIRDKFHLPYFAEFTLNQSLTNLQSLILEPGRQQLKILTEPFDAEALVYIDGQPIGAAPLQIETSTGNHQIYAQTNGRKTQVLDVALNFNEDLLAILAFDSSGTSQAINIKDNAVLSFDSQPSGIDVFVEDQNVGRTPFQGTDFVKGKTYRISLKDDGFKPYIFDVNVTENLVQLPPVTLEPGFGDVIILTETFMPGARVYIDGKSPGEAPYQGRLAAGPHQIYVMNDQKQSLTSEIMVKTDKLLEVIVTFTSNPKDRYQIKAYGHVIEDQVTGLQWARCSLGQEWDGTGCEGETELLNWTDALNMASKDKTGGINDWRLPTIEELRTLAFCSSGEPEAFANGSRCQGEFDSPTVDQQFFPNTGKDYYWSSSPNANSSSRAWGLYFGTGYDGDGNKTYSYSVRLVRGQ